MSARRIIWVECDANGESCHVDSTDGSIAGGASHETAQLARSMAKDIGWHRTRGRDICPPCWDEGLR